MSKVDEILQSVSFTPDMDVSDAASKFMDQVKTLMLHVYKTPDESVIEKEQAAVGSLYKYFFDYSMKWAGSERGKYANQPNHPNAADLKKAAANTISDLQANIIRFAECYMRLNRSMGLINEELQRYERKAGAAQKVQWTSDTGVLLAKYRKERIMLKQLNEKFLQGQKILEGAEKKFSGAESAATKVFGKQADEALRPVRSALRGADFAKAKKSLSSIVNAKRKFTLDKKTVEQNVKTIKKNAEAYISALEENQDVLKTPDEKLFLKAAEVGVVIKAQEGEIDQKNKFIQKYHQPYMEAKLKSLRHYREKLVVAGSLEGLMTLYIKLLRGMTEPLADIKAVREYEADVIENVKYLLGGQFLEIENIERHNDEVMQEFKLSVQDYEEHAGGKA